MSPRPQQPICQVPHLSAVVSIGAGQTDLEQLHRLDAALLGLCDFHELVVIAHGCEEDTTKALNELVEQCPDTTVHFLADPVDSGFAKLVGLDNALGDWILLCTPTDWEISQLPQLFAKRAEGYDSVTLGVESDRATVLSLRGMAERAFVRLYRLLSDLEIGLVPPRLRLLSRAAGLRILADPRAEMLMKSPTVGAGFPAAEIRPTNPPSDSATNTRVTGRSFNKGISALLNVGSLPMRLLAGAALFTGLLNFLYMLYVFGAYMLRADVTEGWTTLSLQVSGMFLIFSLMFALLGEYVFHIHRRTNARLRYMIVRELRSGKTRRYGRPNVVQHQTAVVTASTGNGEHETPIRLKPEFGSPRAKRGAP